MRSYPTKAYKQATARVLQMFASDRNHQFSKGEIKNKIEKILHKQIAMQNTYEINIDLILESLTEKGYITCNVISPFKFYKFNG